MMPADMEPAEAVRLARLLWAGPLHLTLAGKITHGPEYRRDA